MSRLAMAFGGLLMMLVATPTQAGEADWSETGKLNVGRLRHTAALLDDGRVLVAGGQGGPGTGPLGYLSSCEVYDPASGSWAMTGSLNQARNAHSMILLGNGRVLVAGGKASHNGFLASCELYDPATGTWSVTGSMSQRREHLALTLLNDGRVLATGGQFNHDSPSSSCELYDPSTGTWRLAGNMARARAGHTATLLNDGRVLVAGGGFGSSPGIASCEIYDPATDTWTLAASLNQARSIHRAVLLPDGCVLVIGGADTSWLSSCEIYDPTTDRWSYTDSLSSPRAFMTATLLENGRVLAAGGSPGYLATCELYDPDAGTWSSAVSMDQGRTHHTAILLPDGAVLAAGGYYVEGSTEYFLTSCELFAESISVIDIDIKPGSDPNSINLKSKGVLPVAILTTDDFDALDMDEDTVELGDPELAATATLVRSSAEDVDGDGDEDLVLFFSVPELVANGALNADSETAVLTGETFGGTPITGSDSVRIVPAKKAKKK